MPSGLVAAVASGSLFVIGGAEDRVGLGPGDAVAVVHATGTAPDLPADVGAWFADSRARRLGEHPAWPGTVLAAAPVRHTDALVFGRRGGPEILDSELARLGHLCALAAAIAV